MFFRCFWIFIFTAVMFVLRTAMGAAFVVDNNARKENHVRTMTIEEFEKSVVVDASFCYVFAMFFLSLIEMVVARVVFGRWLYFVNWASVSLMVFPMVYAVWYVNHHAKWLRSNGRHCRRLYNDIFEESKCIAFDVYGRTDRYEQFRKQAEDERKSNVERYGIDVNDEVPRWMDDGILTCTILCNTALALLNAAMMVMHYCKK